MIKKFTYYIISLFTFVSLSVFSKNLLAHNLNIQSDLNPIFFYQDGLKEFYSSTDSLKVGHIVEFIDAKNKIRKGKVTLIEKDLITIECKTQKVSNYKNYSVSINHVMKPKRNKYGYAVNDEVKVMLSVKNYKAIILSLTDEGANVRILESPLLDKEMYAPYSIILK
jgi:hypothetical protein